MKFRRPWVSVKLIAEWRRGQVCLVPTHLPCACYTNGYIMEFSTCIFNQDLISLSKLSKI